MGIIKRIMTGFANQTIGMLPVCLFLSALCFWVALPLLSNNHILDDYGIETSGEITDKTSRQNRAGHTYYAHYKFTHRDTANSSPLYDADVLAGMKEGEQAIPKKNWNELTKGDRVSVEYLPYKGGITSRIFNPAIDWVANLLLTISGFTFLCFLLIIFGKLSRQFGSDRE
jgi:hypothetical protein